MKQVIQSLRDGKVEVVDIPAPADSEGRVLIQTSRSLLSAGTERMLMEFGKANWIQKARGKPEKVREVLDKVQADGLLPTVQAVKSKLDQPIPLGYSNVGVVVGVGDGVTIAKPGDRVVSNGHHAEMVGVPPTLCARIPESVSDDEAAFTVLGAIALQGVRLANPTLGERFAVVGLGLIGLLTVQILRASGCHVLGIDPDESRRALAERFGARTADSGRAAAEAAAQSFSRGQGIDGVLLTLSSQSDEPIRQAAQMSRKRGRIILVGVTGLALKREDFYEKELSFQVSCSYGPGRYDPSYEEKGQDYPYAYVRWTEQRNFEAVLEMMSDGRLDVIPLISHRFPIDKAAEAYEVLTKPAPSLGILLEYDSQRPEVEPPTVSTSVHEHDHQKEGTCSVSFIGAGNYASRVLIPAFKDAGAKLTTVATRTGLSGHYHGRRLGFSHTTTDANAAISSADSVVVATRHNSHSRFVIAALESGKHVFVEKPLALSIEDLDSIEAALKAAPQQILLVGFNRRFAPMIQHIRQKLAAMAGPKALVMTVNAGAVPKDHWVQDFEIGGGRLVGEACHFIDLFRYLTGCAITGFQVQPLQDPGGAYDDSAVITLEFADGSVGSINYFTNGSRKVAKERLDIYCEGRSIRLDNFRRVQFDGWPKGNRTVKRKQDKGQAACAKAFLDAVKAGKSPPIPVNEILEVSRISILVEIAARRGSKRGS